MRTDQPRESCLLLDLPQELKDFICDHLLPLDILHLSRTCSTLHVVLLPRLYQDISIDLSSSHRKSLKSKLSRNTKLASFIKTMRVKVTKDTKKHLVTFISLATNLTQFFCEWKLPLGPHVNHILDENVLCAALEPVKHRLTHLRVSHQPRQGYYRFGSLATDHHVSLQDFQALKVLEVSLYVLLGWSPRLAPQLASVLPPNLVMLKLLEDYSFGLDSRWETAHVEQKLQEFMSERKWEDTTPSLQEICISRSLLSAVFSDESNVAMYTELGVKKLCKDNGLDCLVSDSL